MITFKVGAKTDIGNHRETNQDSFLVSDAVLAVADGMGGHAGGEVASLIAVEALAEIESIESIDELILGVESANERVISRAEEDPDLEGMGTTVTVLVALDRAESNRIGVANVGDSRLYRLTESVLHQHTRDHSLVEEMVRSGELTPAEARDHPWKNVITRALGIEEEVGVDAWELVPVTGDRYLICSDGLFNEVDDAEIADVLTGVADPQAAADDLVKRACEAGGHDNVTVVVVDIVSADSVDDPPELRVTDVRLGGTDS